MNVIRLSIRISKLLKIFDILEYFIYPSKSAVYYIINNCPLIKYRIEKMVHFYTRETFGENFI